MDLRHDRAVAIVGLGAILPDAPSAPAFWQNICHKRYSIRDVPAGRWSVEDYYDPDPSAPDKTYSKIGGWVDGFEFDWKQFKIPPRVSAAMDQGQQWGVSIAAEALADYGYPQRPLDLERTGVVLGTAMGGELHYLTNLRIYFPEYARALEAVSQFSELPAEVRTAILRGWHEKVGRALPPITEDSMPGELPNVLTGRIANVLNLRGPNFITDAACASSFAAIDAAVDLLAGHKCDAVITGGVDRNMGAGVFVKFCKIGALSATGTRPFGDGADGFVMGEGSASFLLKRLADAERDGDRVYAVIRGVGASSDGKGKGITAPNPIGQKLAVERAWHDAGLDPATATLVEAHGTSTRVGDVVEVESLTSMFKAAGPGRIGLGSAKSNIGHLKAGAGAAGLLKTVYALHHRVLPPTLNAERQNPAIDFAVTPFYLLHEGREWPRPNGIPRRAGVSAYGFGGTNFHLVLEEHRPGELTTRKPTVSLSADIPGRPAPAHQGASPAARPPIRGIAMLGADTPDALESALGSLLARVRDGFVPPVAPPDRSALAARERLAIDFGTREELLDRLQKAERAFGMPAAWKPLQAQGIFRGSGPRAGKMAFLFPGQGSQFVNMGRELARIDGLVKRTFDEADAVMAPLLGKPLTDFIFVDTADPAALARAEEALKQTAITQPAVLTVDEAIRRLLAEYGFEPDCTMGHSLGEYAALVAVGVLPFADAVEASAARGREMTVLSMEDNGWMAAVMAPPESVQEVLDSLGGYAVAANINSRSQVVVGGDTDTVRRAIEVFTAKGVEAVRLPVSHAFHTRIVAPASEPLGRLLDRLHVAPPSKPVVANVTGDFYPTTVPEIKAMLGRQIASPVQWVKGLETLYAAGVRTFVEVGPKKALKGFVDEVLGDKTDVVSLFTNHPKTGEIAAFNQALCGLYAAGWGAPVERTSPADRPVTLSVETRSSSATEAARPSMTASPAPPQATVGGTTMHTEQAPAGLDAIARLLSQALSSAVAPARAADDRNAPPAGSIVISGCGLGLPGAEKSVMDPTNVERVLRGEQFVDLLPERFREQMARRHVTRVVKTADGEGSFETIDDTKDVIKLAGRPGSFDLAAEYGVPDRLIEALDSTTQLAMAAGLDALREAGIPLVQTFRKTTTGKFLPDRWMLPESMRDETGVIFASAFPGMDRFAQEAERYYVYEARRARRAMLEDLRQYVREPETLREIQRRLTEVEQELEREPYMFDRRFLLRVLAMGHSQFAEYIGARGPNTQVNAACASTAQAIGVAEDWIRSGRCRRVVVVGADNATSDNLLGWIGAGFLASGAAAVDDKVSEAAIPFDRRRHGTLLGMGACGLVIESQDAVEERGMRGIVEVLSSATGNSAFHATRLDVSHVASVVDELITSAERRFGLNRMQMAAETVFVSHETFTPARGGSASAEVAALRRVFGDAASEIVVANTKGFTGHPMGVGVEDVIAVKILEHGVVPPVPNLKEIDPELGSLNLSRGGRYPVKYGMHLAAGFGSQIALALFRRIPGGLNRVDSETRYRRWVADASGYDTAELEITKRVLRVVSKGAPTRPPAPSTWTFGLGPTRRAPSPGDGRTGGERPLPMAAVAAALQAAPVSAPVPPPSRPGVGPSFSVTPAVPGATVQAAPARLASVSPATAAAGAVPVAPAATVAATAPAPAAAVVAPVPAAPADPVGARVLEIVAGKTGYPPDMLDMDLDLEADLGVDTVKQAETFAAVREAFEIPRIENLKLRDFPTLRHVVGFVLKYRPDLASAAPATPAASPIAGAPAGAPATAPATAAPAIAPPDPVGSRVLEIVASKTGYPPDMLDMDLDLEADLGVDTVKQAETFAAVREAFSIPRIENLKLRDFPTLRHVVGFVLQYRPDLARAVAEAPAAPATTPVATTAPAPQPVATPVAEAAPAPTDAVTQRVLAIVAEKTGYPSDMLELDLDLEADLGVDTVKQAETFAAVREAFSIPRVENLKLRDFPTLRHVVGFVFQYRPDLVPPPGGGGAPAPAIDSAAPAVAPPEPILAAAPVQDVVTARVLAIVGAKTGYPIDMLELDLDLEADLGVDTVKQAETFAAIRESFDIPRQENLKLRDFPTLRHVVGFVFQHRPDLGSVGVQEPPPAAGDAHRAAAPAPAPVGTAAAVRPTGPAEPRAWNVDDADRVPRRVATPALRPPLAFCKSTGVTLDKTSRVIVALDEDDVGPALERALADRGATVLAIPPTLAGRELADRVKAFADGGPVHGVFWLPAVDIEPSLSALELTAFRSLVQGRIKRFAELMRLVYTQVNGEGRFLVAATRMGGKHGQGRDGGTGPLGGGVSGFAKAYKRERPGTTVKVVDFSALAEPQAIAQCVLDEALLDPGIVEVGYRDGLRWTVTLEERSAAARGQGMTLGKDSVFVVTGAAGGITSAIVGDLATASQGTFYLLDVVAPPDPADPHVALFRADRERLKFALIDEFRARGEKPTPVTIDKQLLEIERHEAALRVVQLVEAAGGAAHYRSVNLLDADAISTVMREIRDRHGRIDVMLHAGGIEISKPLAEKSQDEFNRVFDIKAEGFFNLLKASQDTPLGATVVFSSVAGRFGNAGQTDYSAANGFLCAMSRYLLCVRPETRAIAIDWSAWGGIGMATRGSIPKIMEAAGIEMLPPEVGVPTIRRELTRGGTADELVVGGRLGILVEEWDSTGGLDAAKASEWLAASGHPPLLVGGLAAAPLYGGLEVDVRLDPTQQPFLFDHQIEGTPVLPGVMGTEAFAEVALLLAPQRAVAAVEDIEFLVPFKFFRMQPATMHFVAKGRPGANGDVVVEVSLRSRVQPRPDTPVQERVHFKANVRISAEVPAAPRLRSLPKIKGRTVRRDDIYRVYFHGPAYQVLERVELSKDTALGAMATSLPPDVAPPDAKLIMAPRLIELCFQTVGILEIANNEVLALPTALRSVVTYRSPEAAGGRRLFALVRSNGAPGEFDGKVVDEAGNVYVELKGYRTIPLPGKASLEAMPAMA